MPSWDEFFVAMLGASAALTGLLFVGISINMPKIVAIASLPSIALRALAFFTQVLFVSALLLVPGLSSAQLGGALLVTVVAGGAGATLLSHRAYRLSTQPYRRGAIGGVLITLVISGLFVAAALRVFFDGTAGNVLLVPAFLFSFLFAINDAWVLLLEINR